MQATEANRPALHRLVCASIGPLDSHRWTLGSESEANASHTAGSSLKFVTLADGPDPMLMYGRVDALRGLNQSQMIHLRNFERCHRKRRCLAVVHPLAACLGIRSPWS